MNLYISNLHWDLTEDELLSLFTPYGEVTSVKIVTDKMSGRSRGFGFCEMPDDNAATTAMNELNGKNVKGRNININEARPKTDRPSNFNKRY